MTSVQGSQKFAISSWVNDQFEIASPQELPKQPSDVDDHPHWKSDPASGVTGEVYLAEGTVYYYAPNTPPRSGWWDMGILPANLQRPMSQETREALGSLMAYMSGPNEAVQYAFTFLADLVTQTPAMMIGGIAAGSVPANGVVTDPNGQVYAIDPSVTGTFAGSISLDLGTGQFSATWTIQTTTSSVTGFVRCVEELEPPPGDRFMFVIPADDAGFFVLTTTNI
jgi:hypothetical protein